MRIRNRHRADTSALRHIGLGTVLSRRQLEQLALHTDELDVRSGAVLSRAGHLPRQFVAVVDGDVDVIDQSGRAHRAGPGTWVGGAELLDGAPSQATVVARTDCKLVVVFGPAFAGVARSPRSRKRAEQPSSLAWLRDRAMSRQPAPQRPAVVSG